MEALIAMAIGAMVAGGVYLTLRQRTFPVILGLSLLSYAVNIFIFTTGRLAPGPVSYTHLDVYKRQS